MKPIKTVVALAAVLALAFASQVSAEGNRYGQPRVYHSEMSVAEAYLAMEHSKVGITGQTGASRSPC
jgi:hypothetical protein